MEKITVNGKEIDIENLDELHKSKLNELIYIKNSIEESKKKIQKLQNSIKIYEFALNVLNDNFIESLNSLN